MLEVGSMESVANCHHLLAFVCLKSGDVHRAVSAAGECLVITRRLNTSQSMCYSLECCAAVLIRANSVRAAARVLACCDSIRSRIRYARNRFTQNQYNIMRNELEQRLSVEELLRADETGKGMSAEAAAELAEAELEKR